MYTYVYAQNNDINLLQGFPNDLYFAVCCVENFNFSKISSISTS